MKKEQIVIVAVRNFSGGTIVLHALSKLLEDRGYDARIFIVQKEFYKKKCSFLYMLICELIDLAKYYLCNLLLKLGFDKQLDNRELLNKYCDPIMHRKRKILPCVSKDTIVVYPEIVRTNFLKSNNVVKYLLYKDVDNWTKKYQAKNELYIYYYKVYAEDKNNPNNKIVYINYFNRELYKQSNFGERNGVCYCIRKGTKRDDLPDKYDGIIIDNLSLKEKVKVFNQCEKCYFYDTNTMFASIAAICGCVPIVIMEKGKQKEDYVSDEFPCYGVAYGEDDIDYALSTRNRIIEELDRIDHDNKVNIDKFIEYINEWKETYNF